MKKNGFIAPSTWVVSLVLGGKNGGGQKKKKRRLYLQKTIVVKKNWRPVGGPTSRDGRGKSLICPPEIDGEEGSDIKRGVIRLDSLSGSPLNGGRRLERKGTIEDRSGWLTGNRERRVHERRRGSSKAGTGQTVRGRPRISQRMPGRKGGGRSYFAMQEESHRGG